MMKSKVMVVAGALFALSSLQSFAGDQVWNAQDQKPLVWKSDSLQATNTATGIKLAYDGSEWGGGILPTWGFVKGKSAVRLTFIDCTPVDVKKLTVRMKCGESGKGSKNGPIVRLKEFSPVKNDQGQIVVDVPLATCNPNSGEKLFGTMVASSMPVNVTLASIETVD